MKKVIITGVTGQDGSHMADYLLENTDIDIVAGVRRLSVENHKNIEHLKKNPRFKLVDLDITDQSNVDRVVAKEKPDYFINFAANSFVGSSWDMPINHMQTNCMAVLYQLEAIRRHAPDCRYYNAGSSEEFGDVSYSPQNEKHPLKPRSPYGASKCAARHLVKVYRESYKTYAVQGWLFNHEGVRRGSEFLTRKVTLGVASIRRGFKKGNFEPLELGNLEAKRDWSDAEDFVGGVWKMLNQEECPRMKQMCLPLGSACSQKISHLIKDYVLASGETHTIREFVEEAFHYGGFDKSDCVWSGEGLNESYSFKGKTLVRINSDFYRPAEVSLLLGDPSLSKKELGWAPKTDFFSLVEKMVKNDILE